MCMEWKHRYNAMMQERNYCDRCVKMNTMHMQKKSKICRRGYDMILPNYPRSLTCSAACRTSHHRIKGHISSHLSNATPRENDGYNFCNAFIAFAIAKLDLAITCRLSLVTSGSACISLSLSACSLSSRKMSPPCRTWLAGRLSWQTATMLDTIVMICVRFSFSVGDGVGLRTPESTL